MMLSKKSSHLQKALLKQLLFGNQTINQPHVASVEESSQSLTGNTIVETGMNPREFCVDLL
jgi:hypothetical protein